MTVAMKETVTKVGVSSFVGGLCLILTILAACADRPSPRRGQDSKPAAPVQAGGAKVTNLGDVRISGYTRLSFSSDLSTARVTGPGTSIDVPEKGNGSHLAVHADDITVSGANKAGQGHLVMHGHLRYTLTQPTPDGERRLNGTAGQGDYRRDTRKLLLNSGVQSELIDPRLNGPGTLHAGAVTVDIASAPYLYTLEGDSGTNDLKFTPKARPGKQNPANEIGPVHMTRWETGTFQAGKIAKFDGAQVIADLKSQSGTPQGQLKARHIQGDFAPTGEITRARANEEVHYHIERPLSRKLADGKIQNGRQEVTGTSGDALYEPAAGRFTLDGAIDATVVNTLSLAEPAKLLASRLVVTEPAAGDARKALRYELTGAANHRRLAFTPIPAEPKPADAAEAGAAQRPVFTLGSIVLTGFQTGVLEPGQKIDLTSDGKQALLLDTMDPKTNSASHMETHHFIATLAETGGITEAQTEGPVTFHIQQPGPVREAKTVAGAQAPPKAGQMQALDGNAARAIFRSSQQGKSIALQGPFTAKVTDPEHLAGPGSVKGQKTDTLSLDLLTREFQFDTPNATMVLDFTPRPLEPEPDKTAPTTPTGKRKK